MIKILLNGCCGKMGLMVYEASKDFNNLSIVAGIDSLSRELEFPIFKSAADVNIDYDVLLDFSRPEALNDLLNITEQNKKPLVLCSTGYSSEQLELIAEKSKVLPLFKSANMSLGINLINSLLRKISPILFGEYDIEIIEKHHNQKVDAPSGTALLLGDTIRDSITEETKYVFGRDGYSKREHNEIGVHAVRGGSIVGDHDIIFAGTDEVIQLSHQATSRKVFALGALKACEFMSKVDKAGLYNMDNVLNIF